MSITTGELFAKVHGDSCKGNQKCHWCGSACEQKWPHDDMIIPFVKSSSFAKYPNNSYICRGCYLYRRPRVSIYTISGVLKDRQNLTEKSWMLTDSEIRVIDPNENKWATYERLLNPPLTFSLSLIHPMTSAKSFLHCAVVNEHSVINADTPLKFTVDNRVHEYTVYELEEAMKHGVEYKMGGVKMLIDVLGYYQLEVETAENKGKGRPKKEDKYVNTSERRIKASGVV